MNIHVYKTTQEMGEEAAKLILATRRVLPVLEDQLLPQIDARKLWERIGKPHGEFRKWADFYIKPRIPNGEISPVETVSNRGGKPRKDYLLSRPMAASLAMQANTDEGEQIRRYFYLMEQVVLKLTGDNSIQLPDTTGIRQPTNCQPLGQHHHVHCRSSALAWGLVRKRRMVPWS